MNLPKSRPTKFIVIQRDVFDPTFEASRGSFAFEAEARKLQHRLTIEQGGAGNYYEVREAR